MQTDPLQLRISSEQLASLVSDEFIPLSSWKLEVESRLRLNEVLDDKHGALTASVGCGLTIRLAFERIVATGGCHRGSIARWYAVVSVLREDDVIPVLRHKDLQPNREDQLPHSYTPLGEAILKLLVSVCLSSPQLGKRRR